MVSKIPVLHQRMSSVVEKHRMGVPLNVLKLSDDKQVQFESEEIDKMFLHPDVKNRKIVIFSIIGAFRKGKSFFLDYCLRFLYATYSSINNPTKPSAGAQSWMGDASEPLSGFSWRSGTKRDTTGIIVWSDIFLHTLEATGEKIAIVVMDTQGLFDNETSPADNSRIFALGTLISSIQILNLVQIVQEDQLQYLQFATEFARFAAADSQGSAAKPFQHLLFLIRDWSNPDEFEFGMQGGAEYLNEVLKIQPNQKPELKTVREFILSSFDDVACFLLPYPGRIVARTKNYNGCWSDMDEEFKAGLEKIIEHLLKPENLVLKKINSKALHGFEMKEYIESFFRLFQSDQLPEAQSIYESTVEKQMSILIAKCIEHYKEIIVKNSELLAEENLHIFHEMSKNKSQMLFKDERKMGNAEHERKFYTILEEKLDHVYAEWKDRTLKSLEQIREERAKTEAAIQEKLKIEQEALEAERKTQLQLIELENQKKLSQIEEEKFEVQKKLLAARLEAEKERARAIEAEKEAEKAFKEALQRRLEYEELKSLHEKKAKKSGCAIL